MEQSLAVVLNQERKTSGNVERHFWLSQMIWGEDKTGI